MAEERGVAAGEQSTEPAILSLSIYTHWASNLGQMETLRQPEQPLLFYVLVSVSRHTCKTFVYFIGIFKESALGFIDQL